MIKQDFYGLNQDVIAWEGHFFSHSRHRIQSVVLDVTYMD